MHIRCERRIASVLEDEAYARHGGINARTEGVLIEASNDRQSGLRLCADAIRAEIVGARLAMVDLTQT